MPYGMYCQFSITLIEKSTYLASVTIFSLFLSMWSRLPANAHVGTHTTDRHIVTVDDYNEHTGREFLSSSFSLEDYAITFPSEEEIEREKNGWPKTFYTDLTESIHLAKDESCTTSADRSGETGIYFNCSGYLEEYQTKRWQNDHFLHGYNTRQNDQKLMFSANVSHSYWTYCFQKERTPGSSYGYHSITGMIPFVEPSDSGRTAYYFMSLKTFSDTEQYYVSCAVQPDQAARQVIAGEFQPSPVSQAIARAESEGGNSEENCEESEELVAKLASVRATSIEFQETFSEVQEIQNSIYRESDLIEEIESQNDTLYDSMSTPLIELTIEMCESVDNRPFDTEPEICGLVQAADLPTPSPVSSGDISEQVTRVTLRRDIGTELIQWGATLLADTNRIARYPSRVKRILEDNEELMSEYNLNRIRIDSKQSSIASDTARIERTAEEAYHKFTEEVEGREIGVSDGVVATIFKRQPTPISPSG